MKPTCPLLLAGVLVAGHATQARAQHSDAVSQHEIYGTIDSISGSHLVVWTRTGATVRVDALTAMARGRSAVLFVGRAVDVLGTRDAAGVLHAETIRRAKSSSALWPPDR